MVAYTTLDTAMDSVRNMYAESYMYLSTKHNFLTGNELEISVYVLLRDPPYGSRF